MQIRRLTLAIATTVLISSALGACSSDPDAADPGSGESPTAPGESTATITMWARSENVVTPKLVQAYNESHKSQIKLTIIPGDDFITKVATAAGAKALPDLLVSDVVYSPNYVQQGLFKDETELVNKLPFKSSLVKAHLDAATSDGKIYAVPFDVDSSIILYNKTLFKKAGLDPEAAPKNFEDIYNDAKAVRKLGGKTYGFYFGGNCAGCFAYTAMPYGVAAGQLPISQDGKTADIAGTGITEAAALYKRLFDEGIAPSSAKSENGSTWPASFLAGNIGILPLGSGIIGSAKEAGIDYGVAPLPSPDGTSTATFVGGDVVGVSATTEHTAEAEAFLTWSLDETAQVEVWAKNGFLTSRTDLADNKYSSQVPGVSEVIKGLANGYTPASTQYGDLFNNANGPWLQGLRGAIFNNDPNALAEAQSTIQAELTAGS
ncbi:ABC transporter substrate-binding protein [uncultured Friedmanniella sp.]|uniref:ABC transporter substrate-binding protein n=1 Tax=uncultured Friedmanniella sp. TaxID=335381 RepID=UPI0035CA7186